MNVVITKRIKISQNALEYLIEVDKFGGEVSRSKMEHDYLTAPGPSEANKWYVGKRECHEKGLIEQSDSGAPDTYVRYKITDRGMHVLDLAMGHSSGKHAAVFGGARNDRTTKDYLDTVQIGRMLAEKGYKIKTGGYLGLMEAASKGAVDAGGIAKGYTCQTFPSTVGNEYLTETRVCDNIYVRLENLIENTDLFIVQRGGIGTLSELFLALDIIRKKDWWTRPKVILVGEFWSAIFDQMIGEILVDKDRELFTIIYNYDELENYL